MIKKQQTKIHEEGKTLNFHFDDFMIFFEKKQHKVFYKYLSKNQSLLRFKVTSLTQSLF